jgi:sterol desaturase/sphingolipid hydroxylase (fatty acid hydroxylase superfamily)
MALSTVGVALFFSGGVMGYLVVSVIQFVLHRLVGHNQRGGWFYAIHVNDHHSTYVASRLVLPVYSDGERSLSSFYLLPFAAIVMFVYAVFPMVFLFGFMSLMSISSALHVYLHAHYHLDGSRLCRWTWFRRLQALHFVHHCDSNKNFAVIDLFWDRIMGTFAQPCQTERFDG